MAKLSGNYEVVYILDPALGEEAIAASVCAQLTDEDYIASTHRGHGHCIAKGAELDLEYAASMTSVPYHPGAAKYFEEQGVTVPTA